MTTAILLVGVGGQGTILISKILAAGLVEMGYDVKMSEIHGMSQRGGFVTTQLKYGERVYAPNIGLGEADLLISFEKAETLRALPFLKAEGRIISDDYEIAPLPVLTGEVAYPSAALTEIAEKYSQVQVVEAAKIAKQLGNLRAQNIVLLGALVKALGLEEVDWPALIKTYVPAKAVELNLAAFRAGYEI